MKALLKKNIKKKNANFIATKLAEAKALFISVKIEILCYWSRSNMYKQRKNIF